MPFHFYLPLVRGYATNYDIIFLHSRLTAAPLPPPLLPLNTLTSVPNHDDSHPLQREQVYCLLLLLISLLKRPFSMTLSLRGHRWEDQWLILLLAEGEYTWGLNLDLQIDSPEWIPSSPSPRFSQLVETNSLALFPRVFWLWPGNCYMSSCCVHCVKMERGWAYKYWSSAHKKE